MAVGVLLAGVSATAVAQPTARSVDTYTHRAAELYRQGHYKAAMRELNKARRSALNVSTHKALEVVEVEYWEALCEAALGGGDTLALSRFVATHPTHPHANEALFALGQECVEAEDWQRAVDYLTEVDTDRLSAEQMEEYCFDLGLSFYRLGDNEEAREWLGRVDGKHRRGPHARYLLGYIAYTEGYLLDARLHFSALADSREYKHLIPYYLLNIEQRIGNNRYVVEQAEEVLEGLQGSRRAEVVRIAAQSHFALEQWEPAAAYIARLAEEEGATLTREENYLAGYALYCCGEWERAAAYLRSACGADDALTQNAAYHLADCYLHTGDKTKAMQAFSMVYGGVGDEQMREDALYNYCKLLAEQGGGNFNQEIQTLSHYLKEYPNSRHKTEIESYLITACYDAGNLKEAYATLREFEGSGGQIRAAMQKVAYYYAVECYAMGRLEEAEEYCNLALDLKDYDEEVEALTVYRLGEIDYVQGKYASAAVMFDQYINLRKEHQPEYIFAFYNLGYSRFNAARFEAAYDDFADFVEMRPAGDNFHADALNRMGDIETVAKNYKQAARLYRQCVAMGTEEQFYAGYRVAMVEGLAGNVPERVKALEDIVDLGRGPYVVRSAYELGNTLLSAGEYGKAAERLEKFVARYPSSSLYVAALSDLALAYRNLGEDDKALENYKKVVARSKGTVAAHNALGEIQNICVDRNEVDKYFEYAASVGMSGDMGDVQRDSLSFVAAQKIYISGDKAAASAAFDTYLAENPEGLYSAAALYYAADCRVSAGDTAGAMDLLGRLTAMYYNPYTQRGYEKMAAVAVQGADHASAAEAYKQLATLSSSTPAKRREALGGYLEAVVAGGVAEQIVEAADWVVEAEEATPQLVRKAEFAKAKALMAQGKRNPAVALFSRLSSEVTSPEGAESAYIIIETAFQYGSFEKAEELVYEFAERNTPHAYWLAKSFLLLGDVYVSRGDLFQARATYQSIVDGYSPTAEDGIVEIAKERIAGLNGEGQ